jgi:hypothetical protein
LTKWSLLGLLVLVLILLWRARPRPRLPKPKVDPDFYLIFQGRVQEVGCAVFELGLGRLEEAKALADMEGLRRAATALAVSLGRLRQAEELGQAEARADWECASLRYRTDYPALHRLVEDLDLPGLTEVAQAEPQRRRQLLTTELGGLTGELGAALVELRRDPECIWSDLELVVLTLVVRGSTPDEELAAALRAGTHARQSRGTSQEFVRRRRLAWEILHGTPPAERVDHQPLGGLVTEDPTLGAAFVQFRFNEVAKQSALDRASALMAGEGELCFVAREIVARTEYPDAALRVWRTLRPLALRALHSPDPAARHALLAQAEAVLGAQAAHSLQKQLSFAQT